MTAIETATTPLGYTHLTVSDLDRSLAFYQHALGLQKRSHESNSAALGTGDTTLLELTENPHAIDPGRSTGLYHFALRLPSRTALAGFIKHLIESQIPVQGGSDHGVSEAIYLPDPDGNGIEVYHDRPREDWYDASGELIITTQPLDLESVLSELSAGNGRWRGIPTGTVLGHLHLHVADLDATAIFYRDILGMDLIAEYGTSAQFFSWEGYHHHLGANTWNGQGASPPPENSVGLRYFTLEVSDKQWEGIHNQLVAAGAELKQAFGGIFVRDPSSNGLVLRKRSRAPS